MKIRKQLSEDEFMKKCVNCGRIDSIEWNHALYYRNRQINELYSLVPLCTNCHRGNFGDIKKEIKDYSEFIAIVRGLPDLQRDYPKMDWVRRKKELEYRLIRRNI